MFETDPQTVVIVTALDVETKAVLRHLGEDWREEVIKDTVFYIGRFEYWKVAVVEAGPGNPSAAALAERAIGHYKPEVALFIGVGGGVKDVKLGDVVVASKLNGYEAGKDTASGFQPRPDLHRGAHALDQRARALSKRNEWRKRLNPKIRHIAPELFVGPIAAGEKVVASRRSQTAKFLKKQFGDTLAVEMEGRGFFEAVHINSILGTVIRGISDRLSRKATADKAGWQRRAADAASAVAFEMLAKLGPKAVVTKASPEPVPASPRIPVTPAVAPTLTPAATAQTQPVPTASAFLEIRPTLNRGSFFIESEVLARIGVQNVDEVLFSFDKLPDAFVRVIPKLAKARPIPNAMLLLAARDAPLLRYRQYGCFTSLNDRGVLAYDPGGPHRGGGAPLSWGTQLFPSGELWLASNTMVVRQRGGRPQWVPIPFIPAFILEQTFYDKTHAAVALAVHHLGLTFPCDVEMGVLDLRGVQLSIRDNDIRGPMRTESVVCRHTITTGTKNEIDAALLEFFNQLHDVTGYARPANLFNFPPGPPRF